MSTPDYSIYADLRRDFRLGKECEMVRIIVSGAAGRMGQRIIYLSQQDKEIKLSGALEASGHPALGRKVSEEVTIEEGLEVLADKADVLIEFTHPLATLSHLEIAVERNLPAVIGTTGFKEEEKKRLLEMAGKIPCVYSTNMSLGVNLLFKLTREAASVLYDYDQEIIEVHHNKKKDAPSGTARSLAENLRQGDKNYVYGRQGITGPRSREEIGIHAVRAGDIIGEHTVLFAGIGERLELTHRAHSRDTFAMGALKAAKWVVGKPAGCYSMQDVLGL